MALDLREHDHGTAFPRSRARVFSDPWDRGGALWLLDRDEHPEDLTDRDDDEAPPAWVDDPVLAARVAAEQTAADPSGDPVAQVSRVLAAENGPGLAALLADIDLLTVDLADLPALAAAAARLESWSHALSARIAAELAARPETNPIWPAQVGRISRPNIAADELSMRLGIGRRSAQELVDEGLAYERWLPGTGEALRTGRIDLPRARAIRRRLTGVDGVTCAEVEVAVLPRAGERTVRQVEADVDRALLRLDPDGGAQRRERGRGDRRVSRPKPMPDGLAGIWAVLPAEGAARLDRALDASAHELRRRGDPRTLAQLRADALMDAALTGPAWAPLTAGHGDGAADDGHAAPSARRPRAEVRVTVPLSTLIGLDDATGELDGHGPIDAATARALAAGGTWRRLVTDPLSGAVLDVGRARYRPPAELAEHVIARDRTCARPGCIVPATACDLDHTVPYGSGGTTSADNLAPLCRRDHLLRTHAGHRIDQIAPGQIVWTSLTRRYHSVPGRDGEHRMLVDPPGAAVLADDSSGGPSLDRAVAGLGLPSLGPAVNQSGGPSPGPSGEPSIGSSVAPTAVPPISEIALGPPAATPAGAWRAGAPSSPPPGDPGAPIPF